MSEAGRQGSDRFFEASDEEGELVAVGLIVKTRGLRGEVVADLLTDFPERFEEIERLIALTPHGREQRTIEIETHWFQGDRAVFKFRGYDSIEAAEQLVGCELAVPETDCVKLPADEYYDWQLVGCWVESLSGEAIGRVREVLRTGGVPLLVVDNEAGSKDYLIPLAEEICPRIDVENGRIYVDPPEGLLEM